MGQIIAKVKAIRIFSYLELILYPLIISLVTSVYSVHTGFIRTNDSVTYLFILVLAITVVLLVEIGLYKLCLLMLRPRKRKIIPAIFVSVCIQIFLLTSLVAMHRLYQNDFISGLILNNLYLMIAILGIIVFSNLLSIYLLNKSNINLKLSNKMKYIFNILLMLVMAISMFEIIHNGNPTKNEKNVLFLTIDALRFDHLNFINSDLITPNINKLHDSGVFYDNFYSHAPYTYPSLSSYMTSLELPFHTVRENFVALDDKYTTLAELLRDHGYNCFASSDLDLDAMGLSQGFDAFTLARDMAIYGLYRVNYMLSYLFPGVFEKYCFAKNSSMRMTLKALEFLRNNRSEKFFLWMHYFAEPHAPYVPPSYYMNLYNQDKRSWEIGTSRYLYGLNGHPKFKHLIEKGGLSNEDLVFLKDLYKAEVTAMDVQVGMVLDYLKKSDLFDDTMIILTADHGEDFSERDHFDHCNNLYNNLIHVPLIIKPPKQNKNTKISSLVKGIDLAPTILRYAGIEIPNEFRGNDLLSALENDNKRESGGWCYSETSQYGLKWPYNKFAFSYTSEKYKYICVPLEEHEELYDLEADPHETNNIATTYNDEISNIRRNVKEYFNIEDFTELVPKKKTIYNKKTLKTMKALGYL
jgi:arylsulfatase A-like enzyme